MKRVMIIKTDYLFEDISDSVALWIPDNNLDNHVLVRYVDAALENNISKISVPVGGVELIWPWVEKNRISLLTRFNFSDFLTDKPDDCISNFASKVSSEFRHGASGVQVFLSKSNMNTFVQGIIPIRQDLFFDKSFSVGLNIEDFGVYDWGDVFEKINKINVNSLLLCATGEKFDAKSDFVGRIFSLLESWDTNADLHIMFGKNMMRVGQTIRLVKKMRPELDEKMTVFVEN